MNPVEEPSKPRQECVHLRLGHLPPALFAKITSHLIAGHSKKFRERLHAHPCREEAVVGPRLDGQ